MTTTHVPTDLPTGKSRTAGATVRPQPTPGSPGSPGALGRAGPKRWPWILGWVGCSVWAGCFPLVSELGPQRAWGTIAAVGYLTAACAAALLPRRTAVQVSAVLALLGAVVVPLLVNVAMGWSQSEVRVVQNSAVQLLHTGSPYLPNAQHSIQYDPYLPGMTLFGLPHALLGRQSGPLMVVADARLWFLAAFAGCLAATWRLLQSSQSSPSGPARHWGPAFVAVTASPLVALVATTGGVDLPLIGCCCLGLALAGSGRPGRAGLLLALACAVKWSAWPALPVAALLLHQVYGRRAALRCTAVTVGVAAALIAPGLLITPGAVLEQVVRFPLGMSSVQTAADSPLPGHLLAELGPTGRTASFVLLAFGAAVVVIWLLVRPPRTTRQAADCLAVGVSIAFMLAPAGRFGYLQLPALLLLWPRLALGTGAGILSWEDNVVPDDNSAAPPRRSPPWQSAA